MTAGYSLRARLAALWVMLLASAVATASLLFGLYSQSTGVQVSQAELTINRACRDIIDRSAAFTRRTGHVAAGADLAAVVTEALAKAVGVEGGVWSETAGSLAYAYPTYEGSGPKTDLPEAERETIAAANAEARQLDHSVIKRRAGRSQVLLILACPLHGRVFGLTAWAMIRAHVYDTPAYNRLVAALSFLAVAVIGSAAFLGRFLYAFSGCIARLEAALAAPRQDGAELPHLDRTGERELDRLVDALNAAGLRLRDARARAVAAERFAAIGRLSADIAHEIRNPIAAMRLKAENALASEDPQRAVRALGSVLGQIERVDVLLRDLLNLTQARPLVRAPADIRALLTESVRLHEDLARSRGVALTLATEDLPREEGPHIDRAQVARALDNLLLNALQHAPPGGHVSLRAGRATRDGAVRLHLCVRDSGPGVDAAIRPHLFEPFVTGRADGTGLGLAIARKIALAHRGDLRLLEGEPQTAFLLDLPWRPS